MLENSFWREGIIFCFRMSQYMLESMFPSMNRSSPVPAALMQPQTMMLPPTIWVKQVYLRLIRPPDMVPVIHALGQVVFSKLLWASFRRGFLLGRWPCKPTCCSVWRMVWALTSWPSTSAKSMLAALMCLFFEASFCTCLTAHFFDNNGCMLSYFQRTVNLYCYTSCTLTTLNYIQVSFL